MIVQGCRLHVIVVDGITRFVFECPFTLRKIAQAAGFRYYADKKQWATVNKLRAAGLAQYADEALRSELVGFSKGHAEAIAGSRAHDSDITLPVPAGLQYYPFQKGGIAYAIERNNVLFADDMGLGKTVQAIGVVNVRKPATILIVCTSTLKINWRNEFEKWCVHDFYRVGIVGAGNTQPITDNVVIVNYDMLYKMPWLWAVEWGAIIADEVHFVKNKSSKRGQAFYKIAERAAIRLYLSGTPIENRPIELYHIITSLGINMKRMDYARRFCASTASWDLKGASNLEELQRLLRSTVMVRRLKGEVLKELPNKIRQVISIDADEIGATDQISAEQAAQVAWDQKKIDLQIAKDDAVTDEQYKSAVKDLQKAGQVEFNEMAKVRHDTAIKKTPYAIKHISGLLQSGINKIIVFGHHRDVLGKIKEGLSDYGCVSIMGGDKEAAREAARVEFQTGQPRVFIGSIRACAEGITLTAAHTVVFVELDWIPAKIRQAEDRAHRIGQKDVVLVQHIVVNHSIDARLAQVMVDKQDIADKALDT